MNDSMQNRISKPSELPAGSTAVAFAISAFTSFAAGYWVSVLAEPVASELPASTATVTESDSSFAAESPESAWDTDPDAEPESSELPASSTAIAEPDVAVTADDPVSAGLN